MVRHTQTQPVIKWIVTLLFLTNPAQSMSPFFWEKWHKVAKLMHFPNYGLNIYLKKGANYVPRNHSSNNYPATAILQASIITNPHHGLKKHEKSVVNRGPLYLALQFSNPVQHTSSEQYL
jgi:hypothetical protein